MSVNVLYIGLAVLALYGLYRKLSGLTLKDIRGPEPESFITGNLKEIFQQEAGEADFKWQAQYGNVVRINAALGGDMLLVTDPKALQYILQTSGYNYGKLPERRALSRLHSGHGLVWAEGEVHKRQRKVMLPGFGAPEIKRLFPLFTRHAEEISSKWKDMLLNSQSQANAFNVSPWLSYATLDAIGEAAFDYEFNALENPNNPVVKAYNSLLEMVFGFPSDAKIIAMDLARFVPFQFIEWLQHWLPGKGLTKARESEQVTTTVAKQLVDSKVEAVGEGKGKRDVFSLLVKANSSENEKTRLDEDEMISAMRTILFAGHETTSNSISWTLLELARNPDVQNKLRKEIYDMESTMPYLQAVIKETLRIHPALTHVFRGAARDDVLPLSKPIITKSGKVLEAVHIPKGTRIVLSIAGYNRDPDLWGPDVHVFRPERWLDGSVQKVVNIGVLSNLLTFAGGVRACIGWRFALHEMQAFLVELVSNFEFAPTDDTSRLRREMCGVILPMLEGEKGARMPLKVSLATRDC